MNNEEKILTMLTEMNKRFDGIDSRLDKVDSRLDGIDSRLDGVDSRLDKVEAAVAEVRVLVDVDIDRKLKLLAEGQEAILNELSGKTPIERTEKIEQEQEIITYAIKNLVRDVDKLKAAQ